MYYVSCADIDLDCDWEDFADSPEKLIELLKDHLRNDHNIKTLSNRFYTKIKQAIQEVEPDDEEEDVWEDKSEKTGEKDEFDKDEDIDEW